MADLPDLTKPETPASAAPASATEAPPPKQGLRRFLPWLVLLGLLAAGIYFGIHYYTVGRFNENTNNAYVKTDVVWVTPRIGGEVTQLYVQANQQVKAGQPLLQLDDRDAQARVSAAQAGVSAKQAALDVQQANQTAQQAQVSQAQGRANAAQAEVIQTQSRVGAAQADIQQARSRLRAAQAELTRTQQDLRRYQQLVSEGVATRQRLETIQAQSSAAQASYDQAQAAIAAAQANYAQALAAVETARANQAQAQAAVATARAQVGAVQASREQVLADLRAAEDQVRLLSVDTESSQVVAPTTGTVGSMAVRLGARVGPQTRLMAIVPIGQSYIEANFKETQIARMVVGQPVEIKLDAFPKKVFTGKVISFSPASGAEFSIMPPDNATGNFNKVVQRVPVRISLDNLDEATLSRLRPGLSAEVTVNVRGS